jgi:antitoxin MazE
MRAVVKKWGNSAAIRIPSNVLKAAQIKIDDPVNIRGEQGRIVIEPLGVTPYDLVGLVEGITPDNLHEEVDFGRPVGEERVFDGSRCSQIAQVRKPANTSLRSGVKKLR